MKVVIPIILGTLRTVLKNLEKRLSELEVRGRIETTQTMAPLKSARINVFRTSEKTCFHLDSRERPQVKVNGKDSQGVKKLIINRTPGKSSEQKNQEDLFKQERVICDFISYKSYCYLCNK